MKKLLWTAAFVFALSGMAVAQNNGGGMKRGQGMKSGQGMKTGKMQGKGERSGKMNAGNGVGYWSNDINLTDAQKTQMQALQQKFRTDMKALNAQENITVKEQRERREALVKNHREAVQNILTPEQKAQLQQKAAERRETRQENRETRMEDHFDRMNLNETQRTAVKANQDAFQKKMQNIRQDQNLTREARREAINQATNEMQAGLKSILNAEQMQKWQELRNDNRRRGPQRTTR